MAALIPVSQPPNVEAAYEDMFKEITRKLYGEETGNGLHTLGTPVAHIATTGPTAPEGERSFTTLNIGSNLLTFQQPIIDAQTSVVSATTTKKGLSAFQMSDRSLTTTIEYDQNGSAETSTANNFKTEDHLTTAFGLAALMQNGFPTTGTILNTQTISKPNSNVTTTSTTSSSNTINVVANASAINAVATTVENNDQQRWATATATGEIITWPTNGGAGGGKIASFNGPQKSVKTIKSRNVAPTEQHNEGATVYHTANNASTVVVQTTTAPVNNQTPNSRKNKVSQNNQTQAQQTNPNQVQIQKRYSCSHCPYSTDRRDLYTRHENIHKEEKPFQCYACLKQFNRADHVKKHFLRMHRELTYDINKTRRTIVTEQKPVIFTQRNNNQPQAQSQLQQQQQQQITANFITTPRTGTLQEATSLSIAQTIESVATAQIIQTPQLKQEKTTGDEKSPVKIKREKRFSCCYCPWTGADKWGLKRHLNTHTKPFVCMLCDYKAARSERLATHVLKVHNKKACNKCSFLAENQEEYQAHLNEVHPHDQRPSRNNNTNNNSTNVLRTIGNTLVTTNNQINNFQNPTTSFGTIQATSTGVAIYTTNDPSGNATNTNGIQEIIVNPSSMVGWRLSATGSLIPPTHITSNEQSGVLTTNNSNQKRGAERLFQYLEADGSDPEDYTRQLKMEAISRNTASVAQDFHNAGGVVKARKHNIINSRNNYEAMMKFIKSEDFSNNSRSISIMLDKNNRSPSHVLNSKDYPSSRKDKRAMSTFHEKENENQWQHMKSPPAYQKSLFDIDRRKSNGQQTKGHRLNFLSQQDKENSNSLFTNMEYENNNASAQFQNYVKEIINKYYAEVPLLCAEPSVKPSIHAITNRLTSRLSEESKKNEITNNNYKTANDSKMDDETRNYVEYLSKKKDITITYANGVPASTNSTLCPTSDPSISPSNNKRKRKQLKPKKIVKPDFMTILRDKYLKRLVDPRLSCSKCINTSLGHDMILFPYHTAGSLTLHRFWRHSPHSQKCKLCNKVFFRDYSYKIHMILEHNKRKWYMPPRRLTNRGHM